MWELDYKESWAPKNWCFWTVVVEKTLERSNQSILKEISPKCSLEGLMLKLKLQYFGHLMWRDDSFESTEELYKEDLHNPDNHNGMITHLEPDILECEVKWALESITTNKASGGDGIPAELFQILNGDAVKVLHSICQQIWETQQWPQDWKRSVFIPLPRQAMPKNALTTTQLHLSHMLAK